MNSTRFPRPGIDRALRTLLLGAAAIASLLLVPQAAPAKDSKGAWIAYIGTYTRGTSKGIYAWRFEPSTGKLTPLGLAAETSNPSFLAVHPNHRFLYAANENNTGTLSAFSIDSATG